MTALRLASILSKPEASARGRNKPAGGVCLQGGPDFLQRLAAAGLFRRADRWPVRACVLLAALSAAPALHADTASQPPVVESASRFRKEYILAAGDQLEVLVRRVPEASRTVSIRPDGLITLPLIDSVPAAGLTPQELKTRLTELFAKRLIDPEVTVIPTVTRQPMVYVVGEVGAPSAVPLRSVSSAVQAVAVSGGLRRSAAYRSISLIRLGEDGRLRALPIAAPEPKERGAYLGLANMPLQADDIIVVSESKRSQFVRFLDDFVNRPLSGINSVVATYVNFRFISVLNE
ncbi:MAG: polysaccharide biosynthesis/export family protein [Bryobacteraceae bacterium]|nr:polysaccharide biosynthesis/export family protein [Bryobacteraceae bacterium]